MIALIESLFERYARLLCSHVMTDERPSAERRHA
jgi:hypothetical protein